MSVDIDELHERNWVQLEAQLERVEDIALHGPRPNDRSLVQAIAACCAAVIYRRKARAHVRRNQ